jgi:hypothetical protein
MFKRTTYYEAISTRQAIMSNLAGYKYRFIPISTFVYILKDSINEYNKQFSKPILQLVIISSLDKEHVQFSIKGAGRKIDEFMTGLLTTEGILDNWSVSKISKFSVVD